jgi:putative tryptophan/tyrosine transport system substrate-binding protein
MWWLSGRKAMRRRDFIAAVGSALAGDAAAPAAHAQGRAQPVIGLLESISLADAVRQGFVADFRRGLGETGYVEGRNVAIVYRAAEGNYDRLPGMALDLARRQVNVISAIGGVPATLAARAATGTIPIVFALDVDPIALRLVASLSRPGGNATGITNLAAELVSKKLELMHELLPTAGKIAVLVNSDNANRARVAKDADAAARTLGVELALLGAATESEIESAFGRLAALKAGALIVAPDPFFLSQVERLADLAGRLRVPAVYDHREFVTLGGLMSYGGDYAEAYRMTGVYTGRILKGDKPADLPVLQSTRVEMALNLKTAKALDIAVPTAILLRADMVIE